MDQELLSAPAAASVLAEMLPDRDAEAWTLWLRNNRNQARKAAYRIPTVRISNGAFYTRVELAKFAEWEKSRQLGKVLLSPQAVEALRAFGVGQPGGSTTGRKLDYSVNVQPSNDGISSPFVQLIVNDPLLVFRLDHDELVGLINELAEAKAFLDRVIPTTPTTPKENQP